MNRSTIILAIIVTLTIFFIAQQDERPETLYQYLLKKCNGDHSCVKNGKRDTLNFKETKKNGKGILIPIP